jgi:hypothetical protein
MLIMWIGGTGGLVDLVDYVGCCAGLIYLVDYVSVPADWVDLVDCVGPAVVWFGEFTCVNAPHGTVEGSESSYLYPSDHLPTWNAGRLSRVGRQPCPGSWQSPAPAKSLLPGQVPR